MRTLNFRAVLLPLGLALAISLPALAQSPATSSEPQSPPPQAAPAQAAPSTQQQGAPTQQAAPAAPTQKSSADDENPLNLTDEQKAKLRPIIMEENQQMEALRNDTSMSQEQKIAKANQIRADASPKIKAVLTPEQLQKLAQIQQERAKQQQQEEKNAAPNNSQPPQK